MRALGEGQKIMLTIGHSTLPIHAFVQILKQNSCQILVDVRTIPASRHNPQFAQPALAQSLDEAGIAYRWHRSLGGLRRSQPDSRNTGWRNASFRAYADYMQTPEFTEAIEGLLEVRPRNHTVIMCAEAVHWRCHRALIADALTVRGIPVEHIFYQANPAGSAQSHRSHRKPHQLTSFARVDGNLVWYPAQDDLFAVVPPEPVRRIS